MISKHSIRHIVGNLGSTVYLLAIVNGSNQDANINKTIEFEMMGYTNVRILFPDFQINSFSYPGTFRNLNNLGIKLQRQTVELLPSKI